MGLSLYLPAPSVSALTIAITHLFIYKTPCTNIVVFISQHPSVFQAYFGFFKASDGSEIPKHTCKSLILVSQHQQNLLSSSLSFFSSLLCFLLDSCCHLLHTKHGRGCMKVCLFWVIVVPWYLAM